MWFLWRQTRHVSIPRPGSFLLTSFDILPRLTLVLSYLLSLIQEDFLLHLSTPLPICSSFPRFLSSLLPLFQRQTTF